MAEEVAGEVRISSRPRSHDGVGVKARGEGGEGGLLAASLEVHPPHSFLPLNVKSQPPSASALIIDFFSSSKGRSDTVAVRSRCHEMTPGAKWA